MSDIKSLVQMLNSNDPSVRYDACVKLSAMEDLPSEVINALYPLTIDENQDIADLAQRTLSIHAQQHPEPSLEEASFVTRKTTRADYALGGFFIGTIISGLLILLFFSIFGTCSEVCPMAILFFSPIVGIFAAIISGILGGKKIDKN